MSGDKGEFEGKTKKCYVTVLVTMKCIILSL